VRYARHSGNPTDFFSPFQDGLKGHRRQQMRDPKANGLL
jgi:hypothetical protein